MAQQGKASPAMVCNTVCHVLDQAFFREASHQPQKNRAPGMDQVTAQQDAESLEDTRRDLHARLCDHR
jgi:hypothetical protein